MSKIYNNPIPVNNGVRLNGPAPLDDRLVLSDISDVYINAGTPNDCVLYGKIYKGAQITVYESIPGSDKKQAIELILEDDSPYIMGHPITVNAANIYQYWKNAAKDAHDESVYNTYYHRTDAATTDRTLVPHGCMDTGVTPDELQNWTFSQIIEKILFEFCKPEKRIDAAFSIAATGSYATGSAIEVGSPFPTTSNLSNSYQSETWYWISKQDPQTHGPVAALSVKGTVTYMYNTTASATGGIPITDESYASKKVVEGTNGYLYATCTQTAGVRPQDSRGSQKDPVTGNWYANPITETLSSNVIQFTGAWRPYTNAGWTGTNMNTAWSRRTTEPGTFKGDSAKDVVSNVLFYQNSVTVYFQWPSGAQGGTDTAQFHVYCPDTYKISSANLANNNVATFDIPVSYNLSSTRVTITNSLGASGTFKNYTIGHSTGVTNV